MPSKKAPPGSLLKRPLGQTFISDWRHYREMKQEELAASVRELTGRGLTGATLSRIENGKSPYQQWQLEAIAEILECTVVDLISRDPQDREGHDLLWRRLSPANRETALAMMRALEDQQKRQKAA